VAVKSQTKSWQSSKSTSSAPLSQAGVTAGIGGAPQTSRRAAASAPAQDTAPELERHSGFSIINRQVSDEDIASGMAGRSFLPVRRLAQHSISSLQRQLDAGGKEWITMGIVEAASQVRTSAKGNTFGSWSMTDFRHSLTVLLFGAACGAYAKLPVGSVVVVFQPSLVPSKDSNRAYSLSVAQPHQVTVVGHSADFAYCAGVRKDGAPCTKVVHKRDNRYCAFHMAAEYKRMASGRGALSSSGGGSMRATGTGRKNISSGSYAAASFADVEGGVPAFAATVMAANAAAGAASVQGAYGGAAGVVATNRLKAMQERVKNKAQLSRNNTISAAKGAAALAGSARVVMRVAEDGTACAPGAMYKSGVRGPHAKFGAGGAKRGAVSRLNTGATNALLQNHVDAKLASGTPLQRKVAQRASLLTQAAARYDSHSSGTAHAERLAKAMISGEARSGSNKRSLSRGEVRAVAALNAQAKGVNLRREEADAEAFGTEAQARKKGLHALTSGMSASQRLLAVGQSSDKAAAYMDSIDQRRRSAAELLAREDKTQAALEARTTMISSSGKVQRGAAAQEKSRALKRQGLKAAGSKVADPRAQLQRRAQLQGGVQDETPAAAQVPLRQLRSKSESLITAAAKAGDLPAGAVAAATAAADEATSLSAALPSRTGTYTREAASLSVAAGGGAHDGGSNTAVKHLGVDAFGQKERYELQRPATPEADEFQDVGPAVVQAFNGQGEDEDAAMEDVLALLDEIDGGVPKHGGVTPHQPPTTTAADTPGMPLPSSSAMLVPRATMASTQQGRPKVAVPKTAPPHAPKTAPPHAPTPPPAPKTDPPPQRLVQASSLHRGTQPIPRKPSASQALLSAASTASDSSSVSGGSSSSTSSALRPVAARVSASAAASNRAGAMVGVHRNVRPGVGLLVSKASTGGGPRIEVQRSSGVLGPHTIDRQTTVTHVSPPKATDMARSQGMYGSGRTGGVKRARGPSGGLDMASLVAAEADNESRVQAAAVATNTSHTAAVTKPAAQGGAPTDKAALATALLGRISSLAPSQLPASLAAKDTSKRARASNAGRLQPTSLAGAFGPPLTQEQREALAGTTTTLAAELADDATDAVLDSATRAERVEAMYESAPTSRKVSVYVCRTCGTENSKSPELCVDQDHEVLILRRMQYSWACTACSKKCNTYTEQCFARCSCGNAAYTAAPFLHAARGLADVSRTRVQATGGSEVQSLRYG